MPSIRLLSTDFDGTLSEPLKGGSCPAVFAEQIERHAAAGGLWAVNTGRSLDHAISGIEEFGAPVSPDFLLTTERNIYRRTREEGWVAESVWNLECQRRHEQLFREAAEMFGIVERMAARVAGVTILHEEDAPAGLRTETEELMAEVVLSLEREAARLFPDFSYQRNSVYLRFCHRDYHKGSALGELCRLEGVSPGDVLAAGDHYNDVSMLDGVYAAMAACPANAIEPVKEVVRRAKGYVARQSWAEGIAEAMAFFRTAELSHLPVPVEVPGPVDDRRTLSLR